MDIFELYRDYSIEHYTEGYKQCRPGWVNIDCPFCTGNPGPHLGYNLEGDYYFCWRCGWHSIEEVISTILKKPFKEVDKLLKEYDYVIHSTEVSKVKVRCQTFSLPSNTEPLQRQHRDYLEGRGFDAKLLEKTWHLLGTGPYSKLKEHDYRFRIIIPVIWEGSYVSFDSRDITGLHTAKYKACPDAYEVIPRKSILYGLQDKWTTTGICVEGPADVWRFGVYSFATFGIAYTPAQLRIMSKLFKRIAVIYDGPSKTSAELEAANKAKSLVSELKFRGVDAFRVPIVGDPGGMTQSEADYIVKQIIH